MAHTNRNMFKVRMEQSDEDLQKAFKTKLHLLADDAYEQITLHWRIKGHDPQFELTRDELLYLIRWIEDMDVKIFMQLLMETFIQFNVEMFNTAGWLQTVHEKIEYGDRRKVPPHTHIDQTLPGNGQGRAVFNSEEEAAEFRDWKKKKSIMRAALEDSGVGNA